MTLRAGSPFLALDLPPRCRQLVSVSSDLLTVS
jgi:hypothetical protein